MLVDGIVESSEMLVSSPSVQEALGLWREEVPNVLSGFTR
jgi:hypothetical protein